MEVIVKERIGAYGVIIQNGKIVGAVTHVFLNDPTRGYGIFAENMVENLVSMEQESVQKAS